MAKKSAAFPPALADPSVPLRLLVLWNPAAPGAEQSTGAIDVAAWLGRSTRVRVRVASTFVQPWTSAPFAKLGGKYKKWLKAESSAYADAVRKRLADSTLEKKHWDKEPSALLVGPSQPRLLTDAAADFKADIILLGPHQASPKHRLLAGSTADSLLHYSPVAVGLAPTDAKLAKGGVKRINFAFSEDHHEGQHRALRQAASLTARLGVPLRLVAFSPTGLIHPPLNAQVDVTKKLATEWHEHTLSLLDRATDLVQDEFPQLEVSSVLGSGAGWQGAVDAVKWKKSDLMVFGSNPISPFARVFLGSRATELLPHLTVPVLVIPSEA